MRSRKRLISWLAFLAMLCYGFVPAYASLLGYRPTPAACAVKQTDTCACRVDRHGAKDCCCSHEGGSTGCQVNRLPCDSSPVQASSFSTHTFPLTAPTAAPLAPRPNWLAARFARLRAALRPWAGDLTTPPPQRLSIA